MERTAATKAQVKSIHAWAWRRFLQLALAASALLLVCAGAHAAENEAIVSTPAPASIWFHPLPSAASWPGANVNGGSVDFPLLFNPNSRWPLALQHTAVFGMYAGWITDVSEQKLQKIVDFLNTHHMAIEIEAPSLQALPNCGSGVEGYVPYGQSLSDFTLGYLQKLRALGADVAFVKVDEPFYFGTVVNDPRSCHFPMAQVASDVGLFARLVQTVYPNAQVGDVEPIIDSAYPPGVVLAIAEWHQTYQAVTGAEFPFFFADIDFSNPAWPQLVKQLEYLSRQHAMKFGIIYIGDLLDVSDAEWAEQVIQRFQIYQGEAGGRPDCVLFQSWEPHPRFALPESNPHTFTGVIDLYIKATQ